MQGTDAGRLPRQIPFIIADEACERFSFYGMRSILTIFLVDYLLLRHHADAAFYWSINLGSFFASAFIPMTLSRLGPAGSSSPTARRLRR